MVTADVKDGVFYEGDALVDFSRLTPANTNGVADDFRFFAFYWGGFIVATGDLKFCRKVCCQGGVKNNLFRLYIACMTSSMKILKLDNCEIDCSRRCLNLFY